VIFEFGNTLLGASLEVFANNGRLVYQSKIQNLKSIIGSELSKVIYLLKVSSGEHPLTKKLIQL